MMVVLATVQSGFNINNSGGALNSDIEFSRNINLQSTSALISDAVNVGYVNFTKFINRFNMCIYIK
jgi:hypothetical protein